ncbi:3-oxoacyl-(Acyl-carrier-protein) reductase [Nitrospira sp. KM1]|uniref:SDR family NAD(P)-dependent oxidoreductase n=1 Tax=Nitrospira sp. KM1 TaxID=1936990 RepID=UPI0013A78BA5|nr:SDR family NAD(P)-dependent oxidoreductase [Nitrospira sp. KM1]BCA53514.1 3-oxoacyl-(Acyl-carrier-protein) reductase [Nitrospira sp. KM1]
MHTIPHPSAEGSRAAVLVTGASGGIGRAVSLAFAGAGYFVGIHYRSNKTAAAETLDLVRHAGAEGRLYEADVRLSPSVRLMIDAMARDASGLNTLVCSAGIAGSRLLLREEEDRWADIVATNLTGTFHCLRAIGPLFASCGGGSIVVIGSFSGFHGSAGQAAYAASKAGLVGLVKTAALEWGPSNIRVNLLLPGWHLTGLSGDAFPSPDQYIDHALQRPPSLKEAAHTVLHMARSQDLSGQVWNCDSRSL